MLACQLGDAIGKSFAAKQRWNEHRNQPALGRGAVELPTIRIRRYATPAAVCLCAVMVQKADMPNEYVECPLRTQSRLRGRRVGGSEHLVGPKLKLLCHRQIRRAPREALAARLWSAAG